MSSAFLSRTAIAAALAAFAPFAAMQTARPAAAAVAVSVDTGAHVHPFSPLILGIA
jgi:hypothetical protein